MPWKPPAAHPASGRRSGIYAKKYMAKVCSPTASSILWEAFATLPVHGAPAKSICATVARLTCPTLPINALVSILLGPGSSGKSRAILAVRQLSQHRRVSGTFYRRSLLSQSYEPPVFCGQNRATLALRCPLQQMPARRPPEYGGRSWRDEPGGHPAHRPASPVDIHAARRHRLRRHRCRCAPATAIHQRRHVGAARSGKHRPTHPAALPALAPRLAGSTHQARGRGGAGYALRGPPLAALLVGRRPIPSAERGLVPGRRRWTAYRGHYRVGAAQGYATATPWRQCGQRNGSAWHCAATTPSPELRSSRVAGVGRPRRRTAGFFNFIPVYFVVPLMNFWPEEVFKLAPGAGSSYNLTIRGNRTNPENEQRGKDRFAKTVRPVNRYLFMARFNHSENISVVCGELD